MFYTETNVKMILKYRGLSKAAVTGFVCPLRGSRNNL